MNTIYIVGYNSGSYDDYSEVNLKAFARREDAEEYEKICIAADLRYVGIAASANVDFKEGWYRLHGAPCYDRRLEYTMDEVEFAEVRTTNNQIMQDWYLEAGQEYMKCLITAGASQAEALEWTNGGTSPTFHFSWEDRSYTIEELEFEE